MTPNDIEQKINEGAEITRLLVEDQEMASNSWSHFVTLHKFYTAEDGEWRAALHKLSQSGRLFAILDALFRDTVMACLRLVDDDGKAESLVKIHKILSKQPIQKRLIDGFDALPTSNKEQAEEAIENFLRYFPEKWPETNKSGTFWPRKSWVPKDWGLVELRTDFTPLRNHRIAHRNKHERQYQIVRLDQFVKLNEKLMCNSAWLFHVPYTYALEDHQEEAEDFWSYAKKGFVE